LLLRRHWRLHTPSIHPPVSGASRKEGAPSPAGEYPGKTGRLCADRDGPKVAVAFLLGKLLAHRKADETAYLQLLAERLALFSHELGDCLVRILDEGLV
jgi:hypothetical protein